MTSKARCLAAIAGQPVDRTPVFPLLMFFAQSRAGITYRRFATDGQALAEAQLNIKQRFPVDALTVCSDAFRLAAALGAEMVFPEDNWQMFQRQSRSCGRSYAIDAAAVRGTLRRTLAKSRGCALYAERGVRNPCRHF